MVIYPVPVAVTQTKVQLVIDETAKAPAATINDDVQAVIAVQRQAEQEASSTVRERLSEAPTCVTCGTT
jgi:hypothetical protein